MKKEIKISDSLYKELEVALKKKPGTMSLDEFVAQLIQEGLSKERESVYQQHDEDKIKDRLKSLGYID